MTTMQLKISFYGLATVIVAGFFGYFLSASVGGLDRFWILLGLGLVFVALCVLQILFIKDFWIFIVIAMQSLIIGFFSKVTLIGLGVFILVMLWAVWRGRGVALQGLKIDLSSINRAITPIIITAFSLLIAFVYTPTLISADLTVGQPVVVSIFSPALPFLESYVPGISLDMTMRNFLKAASGSLLPKEINALPQEERNTIIAQSEGQLLESLSNTFGIKVSARDSLSNIAVRAINAQLLKIPESYRQYIDLGFGLLVFLTIKGFGFIFVYVVYLLALLIYGLLRITNFISIVTEKVDKEIIQI